MHEISDPQDIVQQAQAKHQAGDLAGALELFQKAQRTAPDNCSLINICGQLELQRGHMQAALNHFISSLQKDPRQIEIWRVTGSIWNNSGNAEQACRCFTQGLALNPDHVGLLSLRGVARATRGMLKAALEDFSHAIACAQSPKAELFYNRGTIFLRMDRTHAAIRDFDQALRLSPDHLHCRINRGIAFLTQNQPEAAIRDFSQVLVAEPENIPALTQRALAHIRLDQLKAATADYRAALAQDGKNASCWNGLGEALLMQDAAAEALQAFHHAVSLAENHAGYRNNLAIALRRNSQPEAALREIGRALARAPDNYRIYLNQGQCLAALGRNAEAVAAFEKATAIEPYCHEAWADMGRARFALGDFPAAAASFGRALVMNPKDAMSWCNHGSCWMALGRANAARYDFEMARICDAENVEIQWNAGLCALTLGDEKTGWPLYEARLKRPPLERYIRRFDGPRWHGETPLAGQHLLLFAEQGAGDVLQFCRYIPYLAGQGSHIALMAHAGLLPVLQGLAGIDTLLPLSADVPAHDLQCPLMSLPLAFQRAALAPPSSAPYLKAPADAVAAWADKLGPKQRPRIGLCVSGAKDHANDRNRSIKLAALAPLLALPADFWLLQPELRASDAEFAAGLTNLHQPGVALSDYGATAGLIPALDLVLSVDTSVAHLAGAIGAPVWIMLPFAAEWRWGESGKTTHWYPSAQLIRQKSAGNWSEFAVTLAELLKKNIFPSPALC